MPLLFFATVGTMFNQRPTEPRAIQMRIENERARAAMNSDLAREFKLKENATWEKKTSDVMRRNHIHNIAKSMEEEEHMRLMERRQRLKELLQGEEAAYKAEVGSLNETSMQRARRLVNRAKILKKEREARRLAFANKKWQEQWRRDCDDLRTIESDKFKSHVYDVVEQQKQHKIYSAQREREEEAKWAEEWENDRQAAVRKEAEDMRHRKQVYASYQREQLDQMAAAKARRAASGSNKAEELARFTRHLEQDTIEEQKRREQHSAKIKKQNEEIKRFNQETLARKTREQQERLGREREEMRIKMKEYEHDLKEQDLDKERIQSEMRAYHQFLQERKEQEKIIELEMERLTQQELDRANADRDQARIESDLARERLLHNVLATRDEQLREKELEELRKQDRAEVEAFELEQQLKAAKIAEEEEVRALHEKEMTHRGHLEKQMAANAIRRDGRAQRVRQARESAQQAERVYRAFLAKEKSDTGAWTKPNHGLTSTKLQFDRPY